MSSEKNEELIVEEPTSGEEEENLEISDEGDYGWFNFRPKVAAVGQQSCRLSVLYLLISSHTR